MESLVPKTALQASSVRHTSLLLTRTTIVLSHISMVPQALQQDSYAGKLSKRDLIPPLTFTLITHSAPLSARDGECPDGANHQNGQLRCCSISCLLLFSA